MKENNKKKEKNKKGRVGFVINIIIIVLLVIAVGVIYFYEFFINSQKFEAYEYKFNELQNEIENIVTKYEGVSVINGETGLYRGRGDARFFAKCPKITGNTKTIEKINNRILDDGATMFVALRNLNISARFLDKGITLDYRYKNINDNLIVYVYFYPNEGTTKRNSRRNF